MKPLLFLPRTVFHSESGVARGKATSLRPARWAVFPTVALAFFTIGLRAAETPAERPFLHPLFCDHAVLQRDVRVPVWGWTRPDAKVVVSFAGRSESAVAGADGKWMVRLKAMPASAEPRTLTVTCAATGQLATIHDVVVGEVRLCSGQSNMEMGIENCHATNDIATADFPNIRLLTVPRLISFEQVQTLKFACDDPAAVD